MSVYFAVVPAPRGLSLLTFSPLRPTFTTFNFIIEKAGVYKRWASNIILTAQRGRLLDKRLLFRSGRLLGHGIYVFRYLNLHPLKFCRF